MKNKYPKQTISIDGMDLYALCRWASLKDAVDIVAEKCEEKKIDFTTFDLKPADLLKYVDIMTDNLYYKVINEKA
jgi:hypothetical protein